MQHMHGMVKFLNAVGLLERISDFAERYTSRMHGRLGFSTDDARMALADTTAWLLVEITVRLLSMLASAATVFDPMLEGAV